MLLALRPAGHRSPDPAGAATVHRIVILLVFGLLAVAARAHAQGGAIGVSATILEPVRLEAFAPQVSAARGRDGSVEVRAEARQRGEEMRAGTEKVVGIVVTPGAAARGTPRTTAGAHLPALPRPAGTVAESLRIPPGDGAPEPVTVTYVISPST